MELRVSVYHPDHRVSGDETTVERNVFRRNPLLRQPHPRLRRLHRRWRRTSPPATPSPNCSPRRVDRVELRGGSWAETTATGRLGLLDIEGRVDALRAGAAATRGRAPRAPHQRALYRRGNVHRRQRHHPRRLELGAGPGGGLRLSVRGAGRGQPLLPQRRQGHPVLRPARALPRAQQHRLAQQPGRDAGRHDDLARRPLRPGHRGALRQQRRRRRSDPRRQRHRHRALRRRRRERAPDQPHLRRDARRTLAPRSTVPRGAGPAISSGSIPASPTRAAGDFALAPTRRRGAQARRPTAPRRIVPPTSGRGSPAERALAEAQRPYDADRNATAVVAVCAARWVTPTGAAGRAGAASPRRTSSGRASARQARLRDAPRAPGNPAARAGH